MKNKTLKRVLNIIKTRKSLGYTMPKKITKKITKKIRRKIYNKIPKLKNLIKMNREKTKRKKIKQRT